MTTRDVDGLVREVRLRLRRAGQVGFARRLQSFFRESIRAHGVRSREVKEIVKPVRQKLRQQGDRRAVFRFAEKLLASRVLEEAAAAVNVAQSFVSRFSEREFRRTERWLRYVSNWGTCDALSTGIFGPLLLAEPQRLRRVWRWARAKNRWYRRAAAVSLIPAARRGRYQREVFSLAKMLYRDPDDMVQKGVGWLLKEASRAQRPAVVRFLLSIKQQAPRLVLRYASEKLPRSQWQQVLGE